MPMDIFLITILGIAITIAVEKIIKWRHLDIDVTKALSVLSTGTLVIAIPTLIVYTLVTSLNN